MSLVVIFQADKHCKRLCMVRGASWN